MRTCEITEIGPLNTKGPNNYTYCHPGDKELFPTTSYRVTNSLVCQDLGNSQDTSGDFVGNLHGEWGMGTSLDKEQHGECGILRRFHGESLFQEV